MTLQTDHLGRAQKVLAIIAFLAAGGLGLVRLGVWVSEHGAPVVTVKLPEDLAAEVGACRQLAAVVARMIEHEKDRDDPR